ncbi:uncharacterized protein LOC144170111 isoform X2 [Haemaphysalis longicornis]
MSFWNPYQPPPPVPPNSQVAFQHGPPPGLPNQGYQTWPQPFHNPSVPPPGYAASCNMPTPPAFFQPPNVPVTPPNVSVVPPNVPVTAPNVPVVPQLQHQSHLHVNQNTASAPSWTGQHVFTQPQRVTTTDGKPGDEELGDSKKLRNLPPWLQDKVQAYERSLQLSSAKKGGASSAKLGVSPLAILRDALEALETLKQLESLAEKLFHVEDDEQWSALMQHVELHQKKLKSGCEELSKSDLLPRLLTTVERRRKKRERLRRQRVRRKQESEENEKHIAAIESKINACRQQILDKANQERQEEEMKEEVDSILSEIRFKINRTRDYLEKLKALKQLRAARKESYQQKGLYVAPEADESFEKGMASVESLLEGQLSDYLKEETALKVMLEVEQKEQYESSKLENKQKAVLRSLFGDTGIPGISSLYLRTMWEALPCLFSGSCLRSRRPTRGLCFARLSCTDAE